MTTIDTIQADLLPDQPDAPISETTRLEDVIARFTGEKEKAADAVRAALRQAADIDNRRKTLDHRLHDAEQRMNILAGSATKYRETQRAQAVAALIQGDTSIELEKVQEEDPLDKLSANDLKLGITELRNQRTEMGREWDLVKAAVGKHERRFYECHAIINAAKYRLAADALGDAWTELMAAEQAVAKYANFPGMPVFVNRERLVNILIPTSDDTDAMAPVRRGNARFGAAEFSGELILATTTIQNRAAALANEFRVMGGA